MANHSKKIVIMRPAPLREPVETLIASGFRVVEGTGDRNAGRATPEHVIELIGDADAVLVMPSIPVNADVMDACPNLQAVISMVIGVDNIDRAAAAEKGILVCNSPVPENYVGVAEATVGLLTMLVKGLKRNEGYLRGGNWYDMANRGVLLRGLTLGIIGVGRIGRHTVRRLSTWEMRFLGYDPYVDAATMGEFNIEKVELEELLRQSDIVSVHALLTGETRNMLTMTQLRMMKPSAFLVNTARGGIVNEGDLAQALHDGVIAGAALDTFANEPLEKESLLRHVDPTRLIMTPHIIGHPQGVEVPSFKLAADTVHKVLTGEAPDTVMNPDAIEAWRKRFWS